MGRGRRRHGAGGVALIFRLVILNGPRKGERITVPIEPMTIGRSAACGLALDDPEVAAEHAVVEHFQGGLLIRDLGSMNRIVVNKREAQRAILKHGDVVEIGRTSFLVQAFVQADVKGRAPEVIEPPSRGRIWRLVALTALAAVALTVWRRSRSSAPSAEPIETATNAAPATAVVPSEPSEPPEPPEPSAPPAVTTAPPPIAAPAVPDEATAAELRRLREELATIKDAFRDLAARSARVVTAAPPAAPSSAPPSRDELLARSLASARREMSAGRLDEADRLLARLQTDAPDYLPAYEVRAGLFEQRGMLEAALGQWALLFQRSVGGPAAERAADEWARLSAERRAAADVTARRVVIRGVEMQRFPDTADYDEMRLVRVQLATAGALPAGARPRVEVIFFDENAAGRAVALTRAMPPRVEASLSGGGTSPGGWAATAAYVVPAGFRRNAPGRFHGYIVRVYLGDRLEDETARPLDLLIRAPSSRAGVSSAERP